MKMEYDSKLSQYSLSISNVRKSDATRYQCQVSDSSLCGIREPKIQTAISIDTFSPLINNPLSCLASFDGAKKIKTCFGNFGKVFINLSHHDKLSKS